MNDSLQPNPLFVKALAHAGVEVRQNGAIFKTKNTFGNTGRTALLALVDALRYVTATRRLDRQSSVHKWCREAFGDDHAKSIEQRGIRLAEEAIEAAQAAGCNREMVHRLVDHVFDRPVGDLAQEIGGVGVTLLALAQAATIDADAEEIREFARVLSKPLSHFAARNAAKNAAGFNVMKSD